MEDDYQLNGNKIFYLKKIKNLIFSLASDKLGWALEIQVRNNEMIRQRNLIDFYDQMQKKT